MTPECRCHKYIYQLLCICFSRELERQREIACLEAQVYKLAEIVSEQRASTRDNVQRKQARTDEGTSLTID